MNPQKENSIFESLKKGNKKAFETLFRRYYPLLCAYASRLLRDNEKAEGIVQDLFVKIWEKRATIQIKTSVKHYLYTAVRNLCLNEIEHRKREQAYLKKRAEKDQAEMLEKNFYPEVDLIKKIEEAIDSLPEKRRKIFRLSREEGLKYKEIAEQLNISVKTVEVQMGMALKQLREKLKIFRTSLF